MGDRQQEGVEGASPIELETAISLLNMIARAEPWWDQDEKPPSRRDILRTSSDCVVAARGAYAASEAEAAPLSTAAVQRHPLSESVHKVSQ